MIQFPATIFSLRTLADGTLRLTVDTQEMNPEDEATLLSLRQKYGQAVFAEANEKIDIESINIPEFAPREKNTKSKSERLRAVLFLNWKQKGEHGDSENYYNEQMELLIDYFKKKLD